MRRSSGSGGQRSPDVSMRQGPRTRGDAGSEEQCSAGSVGQWGPEVGMRRGIGIKIKLKVRLIDKRGLIDRLKL